MSGGTVGTATGAGPESASTGAASRPYKPKTAPTRPVLAVESLQRYEEREERPEGLSGANPARAVSGTPTSRSGGEYAGSGETASGPPSSPPPPLSSAVESTMRRATTAAERYRMDTGSRRGTEGQDQEDCARRRAVGGGRFAEGASSGRDASADRSGAAATWGAQHTTKSVGSPTTVVLSSVAAARRRTDFEGRREAMSSELPRRGGGGGDDAVAIARDGISGRVGDVDISHVGKSGDVDGRWRSELFSGMRSLSSHAIDATGAMDASSSFLAVSEEERSVRGPPTTRRARLKPDSSREKQGLIGTSGVLSNVAGMGVSLGEDGNANLDGRLCGIEDAVGLEMSTVGRVSFRTNRGGGVGAGVRARERCVRNRAWDCQLNVKL